MTPQGHACGGRNKDERPITQSAGADKMSDAPDMEVRSGVGWDGRFLKERHTCNVTNASKAEP